MARTPTTAQLVKPKSFNVLLAILGLLFLIVGLLLYLIIYAGQKDRTLHLTVDEYGRIGRLGSAAPSMIGTKAVTNAAGEHLCPRCGHANPPKQKRACERCNLALFL